MIPIEVSFAQWEMNKNWLALKFTDISGFGFTMSQVCFVVEVKNT